VSTVVPTKPYLIRAIYEWCVDCGYTPYINVKVDDDARVPREYVKQGEIVLNVSQSATRNLKIDNDRIHFSARFNGVSREISVPMGTVVGIFARENGEGLLFKAEPAPAKSEGEANAGAEPPALLPGPTGAPKEGAKSHLKLVK
jgi:stringent starvation protein B